MRGSVAFHRHHRTAILGRGSVFRDNRVVTSDPGRLCGIFRICVHLNRGREGSNVFNQQSHRLSTGLLLRRNLPLLLAIFIMGSAASRDESAKSNATDARGGPLQFLNSVVGKWRGVGQPKRGSRQGAWQETTTCRWDFSGVQPVVRLDAESRDKRQFERLEFRSSEKGAIPEESVSVNGDLSDSFMNQQMSVNNPFGHLLRTHSIVKSDAGNLVN